MNDGPVTERTKAGLQYVIPGAERRLPECRRQYARDGDQFVIPGGERATVSELLRRRLAQRLQAQRGQRPVETTPLFRREK